MRPHRFEIVRVGYDRYSWYFVEVKDGRRRVLAQSGRDYRSAKKAERAIAALQKDVGGAEIEAGGLTEGERFAIPASSFQLDRTVLPLIVEESPAERYSEAAAGRSAEGVASPEAAAGKRDKSADGGPENPR